MQDKYKNFQGVIKLWCFANWNDCDVVCTKKSSIYTADVIALVGNYKIGFIITVDKTTESIKQQIINCKNTYNKIYLILSETNSSYKPKIEDNLHILNIFNKYGLGNIIEER